MSTFTDLEKDAVSVDGFVNENALIVTRRNGPKPSWQYIVDQVYAQLGYAVAGSFVTGFTYTGIRQVGVDANGNTWIYTGGQQNIPHVVDAGTIPSEPEYFQVSVNSADNVVLDNGENLQQAIDRLNIEVDDVNSISNKNIEAISSLLITQGLSGNFGFFEKGFSYVNVGDVGVDANGAMWTYNGSMPFYVAPGSEPTSTSYNKIKPLVVDVSKLGVQIEPKGTIQNSIDKSAEIVNAMNGYVSLFGRSSFTVPSDMHYDAETLYAGVPVGSFVSGISEDDGTSYTGYQSKTYFRVGGDTQDNDSRTIIASGHNALINLFNAQLPNTGNGGTGQSESSLEGKSSITFQAGYSTVNGRRVRTNTSRLQRYQTGGVGPIHFGLQHPTETGVGTRTLFDFDSNGNVSFGGTSSSEDYNLSIYPQNTNTPAGDKRTTIGMRNVQPSGNGCRLEMVARDSTDTASFAINYDSKDVMFGPYDSLGGGISGNVDRFFFGRDVVTGDQSRLIVYDDQDRGFLFGRSTLQSGLTKTMLSMQASSSTKAYNWINCTDNETSNSVFSVGAAGDVTANSYTPFTGCHLFFSKDKIEVGSAVDLVNVKGIKWVRTYDDKDLVIELSGEVVISKKLSKVCAGVVHHQEKMKGGYMTSVAAVGDNVSGELKGFRVNDLGGAIEAGDILCTSGVNGELMKIPDNQPESVVRFKCMSNPESGLCYGYFK